MMDKRLDQTGLTLLEEPMARIGYPRGNIKIEIFLL